MKILATALIAAALAGCASDAQLKVEKACDEGNIAACGALLQYRAAFASPTMVMPVACR